jgi:predicted ester cyclase
MSNSKYTTIESFVEEIFNTRNTEAAKSFVTADIVYHGMGEEVRGIEEFKKWVSEDLSAFPDMKVTVLDDFGDQNKIAIRWTLNATHEKDFADFPATNREGDDAMIISPINKHTKRYDNML